MSDPRWALLAVYLVAADAAVIEKGGIAASLSVQVPDEGAGPGKARVRVRIAVRGATPEVEPARLEDALAAWRVRERASSWRADGVEVTLTLEQIKPSVVALPGVTLRARAGGAWQEFSWPDLLHEARPEAPIAKLPPLPPSPWPARLGRLAAGVAAALMVAFVVRAVRKRRRREEPLHVRALARLAEQDGLAHLDGVVRDYLDARYGLSTRRQTAEEMLRSCATLPEEARTPLAELVRLAEVAKYAGLEPGDVERRRAAELARRVIEAAGRSH